MSASVKLDALSSFIQYGGNWRKGGTRFDPWVSEYDEGTFMFTCNGGDTADIVFNGTEFNVVGATRINNGAFSVDLDGQSQGTFCPTCNLTALPLPNLFQSEQTLWHWEGAPGEHKVTITNTPFAIPSLNGTCLDIDYMNWTSSTTSPNDLVVPDSDPSFFTFDNTWSSDLGNSTSSTKPRGHITHESNATVDVVFRGDRVTLYGYVGNDYGAYSAQLDDRPVSFYNASRPVEHDDVDGQVLFTAAGLDKRNHRLTLTRTETRSGQAMAVQSVVLEASANKDNAPHDTPPTSQQGSLSPLRSSVIAGIIIASLVAAVILGLSILLILGKRQSRRRQSRLANLNRIALDSSSIIEQQMEQLPPPIPYTLQAPSTESGTEAKVGVEKNSIPNVDIPEYTTWGPNTALPEKAFLERPWLKKAYAVQNLP